MKQLEKFIKFKLTHDSRWAIKALLEIYKFQTRDEKREKRAKYLNNIGFSATDAKILSSFAQQYVRKNSLSDKQMYRLHKEIPKYWKQIVYISDEDKLMKEYEKFIN